MKEKPWISLSRESLFAATRGGKKKEDYQNIPLFSPRRGEGKEAGVSVGDGAAGLRPARGQRSKEGGRGGEGLHHGRFIILALEGG